MAHDIEIDRREKCWLVKSSTRILGPHSIDDIAQLLAKKHISIIDEVRPPSGRWRYIREHRIFDEIVQQLRAEQENSPELTQTQTLTATAQTSVTITKTDAFSQVEELTPTPPAPARVRSDVPHGFGSEVKDVLAGRETTRPLGGGLGGAPSFGTLGDHRVQEKLTRSQNSVRWILFGLAALIVVAVAFTQLRKSSKRDEGFDSLISEALRYRSLQLYEKSLASYKKAALIREPDSETQSQMALVLIVLDRQNVLGRRILEKDLGDDTHARARVIDATLGIAISYMMEGSLKEAEDNLQKILVLEPGNFIARLNLALLGLRKGEWRESERLLEDLSRRGPPHPLVLLGRAVAHLESGGLRDEMRSRMIASEIQSYLMKSRQLRQELLLMQAALLPTGDPHMAYVVDQFLSEIAHQASLFVRDLRIDWRVSDWDNLERHCRELVTRVPSQARMKAMRAICLSEAGRDSESQRALNEAMAEAPRDPAVLFTQANLLYRNGLRNEATAVLRLPELASFASRDLLMGRICLDQGDMGCAERSFAAAAEQDETDLRVLAGRASVYLRQDRPMEAASLIRLGLEKESLYLPLIELRELRETRK